MGMMGAPMIAAASGNDVDFMVHGLIPLKFFGHQVWITTTHVTTLIVMIFILILALAARRAILNASEKPEGVQNFVELLVETLDNLVQGNMGRHWRPFVNYIGTIMIFIFISNTSGLFGLRPPTADYGTTLALALITFVLIQFSAFKTSGFGVFTDLFKPIPILFPINLIGEFATPLSMSLRLFGNIMAGTIMMALWYGLLPIFAKLGIPAFLHMYFDLFSGAIQTFVFAMLTMTFITDKRDA
ncbi:MAG TPA: F0F1 ATP synthase subunit A [Candidatus Anaerostipes excrementavium]|uniref:ATP synthase subunit a n=1 Tax=Candidatus Anaerostipes excrementavium TaxID=2838463 RepID=A0A9D2B989_9FIRM|nr:F0F1 ATP synthase subunit A [uncultured Anaerostipes sp.]HIX67736.1 F0F1 ATP synthase subunit A [Candidatus Anaerostipes excrementavium]